MSGFICGLHQVSPPVNAAGTLCRQKHALSLCSAFAVAKQVGHRADVAVAAVLVAGWCARRHNGSPQRIRKKKHCSKVASAKDAAGSSEAEDRAWDEWYFGEYGHVSTHREMLEDVARTKAFRRAIFQTCKGCRVLDVGCGTGILALFAAQAGAARVVAVEANEEIAACAREIVERNGFSDIVSVICGRIEDKSVLEEVDAQLQRGEGNATEVDVIISEWMGYMLVHEGMFRSVAFARDKWLASGGRMIPSTCSLWAAPFSNGEVLDELTEFWCSRPYGVDMSPMAPRALEEALQQPVIDMLEGEQCLLAPPALLRRYDCTSTTAADLCTAQASFEFACISAAASAPFHGLAVWFKCQLAPGVSLSTGPNDEETHWSQTLLFVAPSSAAHGAVMGPGGSLTGELRWNAVGRGLKLDITGTINGAKGTATSFERHLELTTTST